MPLCFSHSAGSLKEYLSNVSIFASKLFICNRFITFSYKYRCLVRCKVTITYNREQVFPYIFTSPRFSWSLIYEKHRKFAPRAGRVAQKSDTGNTKKDPLCGLPKINYLCIVMYKQLTSEQRSQIFALLQRKSPRKEIAHIVSISQSTLSRELKRNSSLSGKYVWFKAHDKTMERRKRSTNMLFMTKPPHGKKSGPLAREVRRLLSYRKHVKTITTDNGPEFAAHKQITQYLGAVVYFAAPYASWQKGAIEITQPLAETIISYRIVNSTFISSRIYLTILMVFSLMI